MKNISECAFECQLTIGACGFTKTDRNLSRHLAEVTGGEDRFRAVKPLIPKRFLDPIMTIHRNLRKEFHVHTLPWFYDGTGILPMSLLTKFQEVVARHQRQASTEVEKLISEMPIIRLAAQTQLGTAYDEDDIPSDDDIRRLFTIDLRLRPIKSEGDFRLDMSGEVIESIKDDYHKEMSDQVSAGTANAYSRVVNVLEGMVTGLERHGTEVEGTERAGFFRNAVVDNVCMLSDILDDLNLTGDEHLTNLSSDVRTRLTVFSPADLREDDNLREAVITDAREMLDRAKTGVAGLYGI